MIKEVFVDENRKPHVDAQTESVQVSKEFSIAVLELAR